ncbi:plastid division protein CDP1, chloroplastic isoform X1 [Arachis stenosperma]|uniref:plastid division protein CDP1, chloroplastic isoform X1 n=1 Tax=Arachis stenosperma TaxID=217475 RepID=UPI0025AB68B3|nr:plastid division protein CDP1, chloroplastic isoform X1 [Arachis stenosperma]XP_057758867.1 plastid division protein CDP1, chloroplastic isoform X1 [Arachis stenosperma]
MAFANASAIAPSSLRYFARVGSFDLKVPFSGIHGDVGSGFCGSSFCVGLHAGKSDVVLERRRLKPVDTRIIENAQLKSTVEIPVSCYQLIGVPDRAEKDEIVKAVMGLKNAEIEEGYSLDVVASRLDLLMDVRDKLLFEPEYAGDLKEKIPPKSSLRIPWSWLPAALCLLHEVGESKLVLEIGRANLQHQDAKPYTDDLLLSMALAECAIAKAGFEKNKVSQGFEALARAQCLLRSKPSLAKMTLLSQIEESLEELAPACTLELLSMPNSVENFDRRRGAIAALRELLRQGLDVEASCQVQDWPSFLSQAFNSLLAGEIVDLLPWDNLAVMRKNKKTIESQNQRVVIDSNCLYRVFIAHLALGFSSKQKELINKAKNICECLIASEGIDLKFEEAFCLFLLGQATEADAVEKLKQLELNSNPKHKSVLGKAIMDASVENPSLEKWLKDSALALFPDTKDCSPALVNFFNAQKKFPGSKKGTGAPQLVPTICHRPLSSSGSLERRDLEEPRSYTSSSPNIGYAVKQLTPTDLQNSLLSGKDENGSSLHESPVQVNRSLGTHRNGIWDGPYTHPHIFGRVTYITVLGCIAFATVKLFGMNLSKSSSHWTSTRANNNSAWTTDSSADCTMGPAYIRGSNIAGRMKKIFTIVKQPFLHQSDAGNQSDLRASLSKSSSHVNVYRRLMMPLEEAEKLVKQWQTIKAEALGPSHVVTPLAQVLDESMLAQWQALADAANERSCYWRFVLLKLSVLRADILSDGSGVDMAEIEALLEEAAELVDDSQQKNPNYYSTYKVKYILKRQEDGSWKFCEGDIRTP